MIPGPQRVLMDDVAAGRAYRNPGEAPWFSP
jgi:hypothetical protein